MKGWPGAAARVAALAAAVHLSACPLLRSSRPAPKPISSDCAQPKAVPRYGYGFGSKSGRTPSVRLPAGLIAPPDGVTPEHPDCPTPTYASLGLKTPAQPLGWVFTVFHVHADGSVDRVRVLGDAPPLLAQAALTYLASCEFHPLVIDDVPVDSEFTYKMFFD